MTTYYCLLKPPLPSFYGREEIRKYFKTYTTNFIDYVDFENWFGLKNTTIPISEINNIFDLASTPELKTVAVVINPYARVFLSYLGFEMFRKLTPLNTLEKVISNATKEGFKDFVINDLRNNSLDNSISTNLVDVYECGTIKVAHILQFENISNDLKTIPEFAERTDTKLCIGALEVAALYKNYYDDETKQIVESVFSKDLIRYNYSF